MGFDKKYADSTIPGHMYKERPGHMYKERDEGGERLDCPKCGTNEAGRKEKNDVGNRNS